MTAKEHGWAIVRGYSLHMSPDGPEIAHAIQNAITAAIAEDRASRECCKAEREMLDTLEWITDRDDEKGHYYCPVCQQAQHLGHANYCALAGLIRARSAASPAD